MDTIIFKNHKAYLRKKDGDQELNSLLCHFGAEIELEDGTTFGDVFKYIVKDRSTYEKVFHVPLVGKPLTRYIDQFNQDPPNPHELSKEIGMKSLDLYWTWECDLYEGKTDIILLPALGGTGTDLDRYGEDPTKVVPQNYSILEVPMNELKVYPLKIDTENFVCNGVNNFYGVHTLPNGLTYMGCSAFGDWEYPIYFIAYWDGTAIRAYIPKGNYYNHKLNCAFGNDEDSDVELGYNYNNDGEQFTDFVAIQQDIINTLKEKP